MGNFIKKLGEPTVYFPKLKKITGSVKSAVLLSQFLVWHNQSDEDGGFYKTHNEINKATGLTMDEQKTAIKLLKNKGIVEVIRKGLPARNYYYIRIDKINESLDFNHE